MTEVMYGEAQATQEAPPVRGVKERLKKWAYETFTVPGRTEKYERKYTQLYLKVKDNLSPEDQQRAEAMIRPQAEQMAKKSMVRDVVVTGITGAGIGVGIWKRKEIGGFIGKHTPEKVKDFGLATALKAHEYGEKMRNWKPVQKVEGWVKGIIGRFRKPPVAPATA